MVQEPGSTSIRQIFAFRARARDRGALRFLLITSRETVDRYSHPHGRDVGPIVRPAVAVAVRVNARACSRNLPTTSRDVLGEPGRHLARAVHAGLGVGLARESDLPDGVRRIGIEHVVELRDDWMTIRVECQRPPCVVRRKEYSGNGTCTRLALNLEAPATAGSTCSRTASASCSRQPVACDGARARQDLDPGPDGRRRGLARARPRGPQARRRGETRATSPRRRSSCSASPHRSRPSSRSVEAFMVIADDPLARRCQCKRSCSMF
jgi:hypothetical protein